MQKAILCWSGGKDSAMALYETRLSRQYGIVSLLTTVTRDYDRVSMHGVRTALIEEQARLLRLPLAKVFISAGLQTPNTRRRCAKSSNLLRVKEYRASSSAIFFWKTCVNTARINWPKWV